MSGRIEVIHGCMYAGKTTELFNRLKKHHMAGKKIALIKSKMDNRYGTDGNHSATHSGQYFVAKAVSSIDESCVDVDCVDVIGVDEGQFMGNNLTQWATDLANRGKIVIIACLDTNFLMEPFDNVTALMCVAEVNVKLSAICSVCGEQAYFTRKTTDSRQLIEVGGNDLYVPTCRSHHADQSADISGYHERVDALKNLTEGLVKK